MPMTVPGISMAIYNPSFAPGENWRRIGRSGHVCKTPQIASRTGRALRTTGSARNPQKFVGLHKFDLHGKPIVQKFQRGVVRIVGAAADGVFQHDHPIAEIDGADDTHDASLELLHDRFSVQLELMETEKFLGGLG